MLGTQAVLGTGEVGSGWFSASQIPNRTSPPAAMLTVPETHKNHLGLGKLCPPSQSILPALGLRPPPTQSVHSTLTAHPCVQTGRGPSPPLAYLAYQSSAWMLASPSQVTQHSFTPLRALQLTCARPPPTPNHLPHPSLSQADVKGRTHRSRGTERS